MSVHISSACKKLEYRGAKREVLLEFADHANDDGICWPSRSRIMYNTGLSESAVKQQMKELREAEVLVVVDQYEGGRGRVPIYKVCPEKGPQKVPFSEWCEAHAKGSKGPSDDRKRGQHVTPEPSEKNRKVNEEESTNVSSSSAKSPFEDGSSPEQEKPMPSKQFAVKELMQRVSGARDRGWRIHSPTNDERKQFAKMFEQALTDGFDIELLLRAFDYQVEKAAGRIDGEHAAWCGFRTALDRVLDGWVGTVEQSTLSEEELQEKQKMALGTQHILQAALERMA